MTGIKIILIIFVFAVFLVSSVSGVPQVSVSQGTVSGSQPSTYLSIMLNEAPNGLSGYNITVSLSDPAIAEIISVDFPAWAILNSTSALPAGSVWIKAVDLNNGLIKGSSNVILANLTVSGKKAGTSNVLLSIGLIDDDNGYPLLETRATPLPTPGGNSGGGSGGGGGGGGGAPSDEDFNNIEKQESRDVDIHAGKVVYKFTTQEIIKEIGFDAKTSEGLVTAKIELLKGRPKKAASDAPGRVYRYFNVVVGTSGYGSSSKLENAHIVFNVPDEWLKNNNIDSIELVKFKDNSWIHLKTEKISPGTYKAYSPGFSGFAIAGISSISKEITLSSTTPQASKENGVKEGDSKSSTNLFFIIVVIIVIIAGAFVFLNRKDLIKK